ncbi:hypothetical protein A5641_08005 [Mycobacterium sp. 1554424.7]|nr:hypothetical protein A5641_08005 [Mycobacterium sp. 1554424.7]
MNGVYDDPAPDDAQGPCESLDFDDVHNDDSDIAVHQSLNHSNRHKSISRRDIDALVELKRLRKAL